MPTLIRVALATALALCTACGGSTATSPAPDARADGPASVQSRDAADDTRDEPPADGEAGADAADELPAPRDAAPDGPCIPSPTHGHVCPDQ